MPASRRSACCRLPGIFSGRSGCAPAATRFRRRRHRPRAFANNASSALCFFSHELFIGFAAVDRCHFLLDIRRAALHIRLKKRFFPLRPGQCPRPATGTGQRYVRIMFFIRNLLGDFIISLFQTAVRPLGQLDQDHQPVSADLGPAEIILEILEIKKIAPAPRT